VISSDDATLLFMVPDNKCAAEPLLTTL